MVTTGTLTCGELLACYGVSEGEAESVAVWAKSTYEQRKANRQQQQHSTYPESDSSDKEEEWFEGDLCG